MCVCVSNESQWAAQKIPLSHFLKGGHSDWRLESLKTESVYAELIVWNLLWICTGGGFLHSLHSELIDGEECITVVEFVTFSVLNWIYSSFKDVSYEK